MFLIIITPRGVQDLKLPNTVAIIIYADFSSTFNTVSECFMAEKLFKTVQVNLQVVILSRDFRNFLTALISSTWQ